MYAQLEVHDRSMDWAVEVYQLVGQHFPREERFGLSQQLQRAVVSVPSNIAEGRARGGTREFVRFLAIAQGSCSEAMTQLELAGRLGYLNEAQVRAILDQGTIIAKQLNKLSSSLKRRIATGERVLDEDPEGED